MDNDYYEMKFYEPKESNMTIEYNHKKMVLRPTVEYSLK